MRSPGRFPMSRLSSSRRIDSIHRKTPLRDNMKLLHSVISATIFLAPAGAFAAAGQTVTVEPAASIEIPGAKGKFDFLRVDAKRNRLLAAHENGATADYFDLGSHKLLARVKVGGAVDNAVDADCRNYYVSVQDDKREALVD